METSASMTKSSLKIRPNSVAFLVATLLFLLPFVDIKCNGRTYASNTGIGLALGTNYKTSSTIKTDDSGFGNKEISITEKQSGKMYAVALVALLLGITGIILSIIHAGPSKINAMIGVLAALALVVLLIQVRYDLRHRSSEEITGFDEGLRVRAEFTAWYYLSLVSFIIAAFLSYWRKRIVISG